MGLGFRIFTATWNVGGKTPNNGINLEDFLLVEDSADIYVIGCVKYLKMNWFFSLINYKS